MNKTSRWRRRIVRTGASLALVAAMATTALMAALWAERRTTLTLPLPTGPFAVGRSIYEWRDPATPDRFAPAGGSARELLAWVWYPTANTAAQPGGTTNGYWPAAMRKAGGGSTGVFSFLTRDASRVHVHSADNAQLSPQQASFPVAVLRGGASASVVNYTTFAEDLASHGYIVVGIDAPYRTNVVAFQDGRVIRRTPENNPELCDAADKRECFDRLLAGWTSDIGFALDRLAELNKLDPSGQFTGRIDMARVGVFGHSFGGSQAAQFCHDDPRCKVGINIDGIPLGSVIAEGMRKPFMFVFSQQIHATDPESRRVQADIQSLYDHLPPHERLRVSIRGSNHFTFSDDGALLKSRLIRGVLRAFGALEIDGDRQLAVTAYCVRSFFDTYLKRSAPSPVTLASSDYPEIELLD